MKTRNYTEQQFINAIQSSTSIRQALNKLGVVEAGGNYKTAKTWITKLNLDTSHFKDRYKANLGRKFGPKRAIKDYLENKQVIQSFKLKNRLINDNIFQKVCSSCKLTQWLEQDIPLELDHINGNNNDNTLSNLRLLCPNCHALTSNYRGKNIKR